MFSSIKAVGLAALLLPSAALAALDKPALWSNLDFLKPGLMNVLQTHGYSVAAFLDGYIASACRERGNAEGYNLWDIQTYVVTFDDCSVEWLMCRHKNAQIDLNTFISQFSRVPVRMRQSVKAIMMGPQRSDGIGAYAYGDMLVMFNKPDNVAVYLHEVTHAVDWTQSFQVSGQLSSTSTWTNSYNADSAVPDAYARSSQVENVAQHTGPFIFNRYVSGGINSVSSGYERISNQQIQIGIQAAAGKYGAIFDKDNVQCTNRRANGGWETLPPRRRSNGTLRRALGSGPLPDREFPNTVEEQQAYVESKGLTFEHPMAQSTMRLAALTPTNCSGYI